MKKFIFCLTALLFLLPGVTLLSACNERKCVSISLQDDLPTGVKKICVNDRENDWQVEKGKEVKVNITFMDGWTIGSLKLLVNEEEAASPTDLTDVDSMSEVWQYDLGTVEEDLSLEFTGDALHKTHTVSLGGISSEINSFEGSEVLRFQVKHSYLDTEVASTRVMTAESFKDYVASGSSELDLNSFVYGGKVEIIAWREDGLARLNFFEELNGIEDFAYSYKYEENRFKSIASFTVLGNCELVTKVTVERMNKNPSVSAALRSCGGEIGFSVLEGDELVEGLDELKQATGRLFLKSDEIGEGDIVFSDVFENLKNNSNLHLMVNGQEVEDFDYSGGILVISDVLKPWEYDVVLREVDYQISITGLLNYAKQNDDYVMVKTNGKMAWNVGGGVAANEGIDLIPIYAPSGSINDAPDGGFMDDLRFAQNIYIHKSCTMVFNLEGIFAADEIVVKACGKQVNVNLAERQVGTQLDDLAINFINLDKSNETEGYYSLRIVIGNFSQFKNLEVVKA